MNIWSAVSFFAILAFAVDSFALSASGLFKKAAFPEIKQLANYFGEQDPRMSQTDGLGCPFH